jgi:enterochelin esterase-like enzyme
MIRFPAFLRATPLVLALLAPAHGQGDASVPGPDSLPQPGVPKGTTFEFAFDHSKIFPGTTRQVTVYIPKQYDPAKPACVWVSQDGVQSNAPVVFDNLIARGELPVIVGVFVTPGVVASRDPARELGRYNRSFEYDGLGDAYARFLLEELLPEVESRPTPDGRPIRLSHSGNDRAIGGASSGAIAAFTAAWERPDAFTRVASAIGTYVGLRGGEVYPTLIRKYEPKPIRVFLQDGGHDLNIYGGDWWMANQTMERALEFAGYEVNHSWGDGTHSGKHMAAIFPDVQRWLWKDWPKPVSRGVSKNGALAALLLPGEDWQVAPPDDGGSPESKRPDLAADRPVVSHSGNRYIGETEKNLIRLVRANGSRQQVDTGLHAPTGIALSPDQSLLYVADSATRWIYSFRVEPDGTLADRQRYFWLHTDDDGEGSHAGGLCCDKAGWLYVATNLGIQICDQAGRVNAIVPTPKTGATQVAFGGPSRDTLYAVSGDTIYQRRLKTQGVDSSAEPVLPPTPHL